MRRHELTDEQFERIKYFLPGRKGYVGATAKDNKLACFGYLKQEHLGEICRKGMGLGKIFTDDFHVGQKQEFLIIFIYWLNVESNTAHLAA